MKHGSFDNKTILRCIYNCHPCSRKNFNIQIMQRMFDLDSCWWVLHPKGSRPLTPHCLKAISYANALFVYYTSISSRIFWTSTRNSEVQDYGKQGHSVKRNIHGVQTKTIKIVCSTVPLIVITNKCAFWQILLSSEAEQTVWGIHTLWSISII